MLDEIGETTNKMRYPRIKTDLPTPPLQRKNLISYICSRYGILSVRLENLFGGGERGRERERENRYSKGETLHHAMRDLNK
jgi:hypothetical protein